MKTTQLALLLGSGLVACSLNAADADKFYLNPEVGASFIQNVTLRGGGESATAEFYPGSREDIIIGYNVCPEAAVEFETGGIWNRFHKIGGSTITGGDIDLYQLPLLANVVYHFKWNDRWTSTFGAGAGVTVDTIDFVPDHGSSTDDTDAAFSYQAQAGIKYALNSTMDLGFNYKFLGSLDREWSTPMGTLKTDNLFTHALLFTFTWKF